MGKALTQKQAVLEHLQSIGHITQLEAFLNYGATRLGAIIYNLKKEGHLIISKREIHATRFGKKVSISRYFYREEGELK